MQKLSIECCYKIAEEKNGYFLSTEYINCDTKYQWMCNNGHTWWATYSHVRSGSWCPQERLVAVEDCYSLVASHDGYMLECQWPISSTKCKWMCNKGHVWNASYNNILHGAWCNICAIEYKKLTIDTCHKIALYNDGYCLSEDYVTSGTKYKWKCKKGHCWEATYNSVQQGHWCDLCSVIDQSLTLEDCFATANKNNGTFLSTEYSNSYTKYKWKCSNHHEFDMTLHHARLGHWCSECKSSRRQKQLSLLIYEFLFTTYIANYHGFEWLITPNGRKQEIDYYDPKHKIGVEYDGEQHFYPISYFGGDVAFAKTQQRDTNKNTLISLHPEDIRYFVRVSYLEPLNKDYILYKLVDAEIPIFYMLNGMNTWY